MNFTNFTHEPSHIRAGVALAASPASPGAGLSFNIWQVLSGFSKLNKRKTGQMSKMQGKFQSRAGLRKLAGATIC